MGRDAGKGAHDWSGDAIVNPRHAVVGIIVVGIIYLGFSLFVIAASMKVGFLWAVVFALAIATAGSVNYVIGWYARDRQQPLLDPWREKMRVTPRLVPLEPQHIDALLAFGENCFGPTELDDAHDEALAILRANRAMPTAPTND